MTQIQAITPQIACRLAISAQKLDRPTQSASKEMMLETFKSIRCSQLDPIRAVERTQYMVLWSRLGNYDRQWLFDLMDEQKIFEYWAHAASIVLAEDYPLHDYFMRQYGTNPKSAGAKRLKKWVDDNKDFKSFILQEIDRRGPLLTGDIDDQSKVPWQSGGWSSGRSVAYMLDYLWTSGQIMVAKRDGLKRWWDLSHRVLPVQELEQGWTANQVTYDATQKAVKGLGIGRLNDIKKHFIEGRYPNIEAIFPQLIEEGKLHQVEIDGWPGEWVVHHDHLPLLEKIRSGNWQGKTTLLSPFDNLIRDRDRTELMWDFYYRIEIYVPKAKREFGYYVLPILHGDQLIGRIDSKMDRKKNQYEIFNVYAQENAPRDEQTAKSIAQAIRKLGQFLGADKVVYHNRPAFWKKALRSEDLPQQE